MDVQDGASCERDSVFGHEVELARSIDDALQLLGRKPGASAVVFERTWTAVDRARQRAEAAGLGRRVSVHHLDACRLVNGWRRAG